MFFENATATKEATDAAVEMFSVAAQIIYALAPAFAAGFAIQRLLEIADSFISLFKKLTPEWKAAILSGSSFAIGTLIAWRMGFAIIHELSKAGQMFTGSDSSRNYELLYGLDYILTGLIISAGTEGLNSIIKFLGYAKEVKKEEVKTETVVSSAASLMRMRTFFNSAARNFNDIAPFPVTGDTLVDVENALREEMQTRPPWKDKYIPAMWKKTPFSDYTTHVHDAQVAVLNATKRVARGYSRFIPDDSAAALQDTVTLEMKPDESLFREMQAQVEDAPPIP